MAVAALLTTMLAGCLAVGCDSSAPPEDNVPAANTQAADTPPADAPAADTSTGDTVDQAAAEPTPPPTSPQAESTAAEPTEPTAPDHVDDGHVAIGAELGEIVLAGIFEEFGTSTQALVAYTAGPFDESEGGSSLWLAITTGPQPSYLDTDGEVVNFFHFAALYRRDADGTWDGPTAKLTIDSAPQRIRDFVVFDPRASTSPKARPTLIAIHGETGAHGGTFDVLRLDDGRLETALSHIGARSAAGDIVDLDGDGIPEVVLNDSNPYVFCYTCAVEEKHEQLYFWIDGGYQAVPLDMPPGLPPELAATAAQVVRLARADLWRDAAALAADLARRGARDDLRRLSVLVNRTAALRLAHAGTSGQPLLTNVLAGEYAQAFALISRHTPEDAFSLDGPLVTDTAAASDPTTMAVTLIDYSEQALAERPADAAIHTVRALGLALASPDDLRRARAAINDAVESAAGDQFLDAAQAYLGSIERLVGAPAEPPETEELLDGPDPTFFEADGTLGAGDRGRAVRALQQRLARARALRFEDPGRYYDVYDEPTRTAVLALQAQADLPPSGVVDGATWQALEAALAQQDHESTVVAPALPKPTGHGPAGEPVVYLTFDDGPHPTWTPQVLETLARYGAPATFFVLGRNVNAYPDLAARIVREGHEAENHTFDHASLDKVDRETFIAEVEATDRALRAAVGDAVNPVACLRPPYGALDAATRSLAAELGKKIVLWNVDPQDWRRPGAAQIALHLLTHAKPGAILLMHDGGGDRSQTVEALDVVLSELARRGYTFALLCR